MKRNVGGRGLALAGHGLSFQSERQDWEKRIGCGRG
jgi:hypothetical protein